MYAIRSRSSSGVACMLEICGWGLSRELRSDAGVVDGRRATAANVGTPLLPLAFVVGVITWQLLQNAPARRRPSARSPASCAVARNGKAAKTAMAINAAPRHF